MWDTNKKRIIKYLLFSIILIIINYIYSLFSHNVSSAFMTYMFIFPLIGMILVIIFNNENIEFYRLLSSTLLTFIIGSFVKGVMDIAGTSSNYLYVYLFDGLILLLLSTIYLIKKNDNN